MATQNPVLYNMGLQQGRSTGAFRGVRAAPKLSEGAQQFGDLQQRYNTEMRAAMEGTGERKVAYDALMAELGTSLTSAKSAFDTKLPGLEQAVKTTGEAYQNYVPPNLTINVGAGNLQMDEASLRRSLRAATTQQLKDMYQGGLTTLLAQKEAAAAPYKSAYDTAYGALKTEADAYNALITDANIRSKAAYEDYAGAADKVRAKFEGERSGLAGLGHLAYASPEETSVSPSPTAAQQLSGTDLYSQDLETQVLGRKQKMQEAPEEDIMSGVMQSSLYRR